ncbi:MAG: hypothetical protein ACE5HD_04250 [Acidobacteriota bacterium]
MAGAAGIHLLGATLAVLFLPAAVRARSARSRLGCLAGFAVLTRLQRKWSYAAQLGWHDHLRASPPESLDLAGAGGGAGVFGAHPLAFGANLLGMAPFAILVAFFLGAGAVLGWRGSRVDGRGGPGMGRSRRAGPPR